MTDKAVMCECGAKADGEYSVWNGMHYLPVCDKCWRDPETIAAEACVMFAESTDPEVTLEECVRIELGFREEPYTDKIQALVDARYCEWYLEAAV